MKTVAMLLKNIFSRAATIRFPSAPKPYAGYRGLVEYDPAKCTGCSMCAFRCTSSAIRFRGTKTDIKWSYDPAQCTFCGRCVDGCESGALTQTAECPPIYLTAGALQHAYVTPRAQTSPVQPPTPPNTSLQANPAAGGAQ